MADFLELDCVDAVDDSGFAVDGTVVFHKLCGEYFHPSFPS